MGRWGFAEVAGFSEFAVGSGEHLRGRLWSLGVWWRSSGFARGRLGSPRSLGSEFSDLLFHVVDSPLPFDYPLMQEVASKKTTATSRGDAGGRSRGHQVAAVVGSEARSPGSHY